MKDSKEIISKLFASARTASESAYSPYSGARVGASVLTESGEVYSGCNVENASYGLTQCAERNALATAINEGMKAGTARAILIYATGFDVLAPCGACRQVMSELMADDAVVISCHSETDYHRWSVEELLPDSFKLS
jgi:cytidine deaminase